MNASDDPVTPELGLPLADGRWRPEAGAVPPGGQKVDLAATPAERIALAEALGIEACRALTLRGELLPVGRHHFAFDGAYAAEIVQLCVVTLEPIEQTLSGDLTVRYWPEGELEAHDDMAVEDPIAADDPPEPIENGRIDLGRLVYEELAVTIDPYPRKPGAEVEAGDSGEPGAASPFAGLARLKREP